MIPDFAGTLTCVLHLQHPSIALKEEALDVVDLTIADEKSMVNYDDTEKEG